MNLYEYTLDIETCKFSKEVTEDIEIIADTIVDKDGYFCDVTDLNRCIVNSSYYGKTHTIQYFSLEEITDEDMEKLKEETIGCLVGKKALLLGEIDNLNLKIKYMKTLNKNDENRDFVDYMFGKDDER